MTKSRPRAGSKPPSAKLPLEPAGAAVTLVGHRLGERGEHRFGDALARPRPRSPRPGADSARRGRCPRVRDRCSGSKVPALIGTSGKMWLHRQVDRGAGRRAAREFIGPRQGGDGAGEIEDELVARLGHGQARSSAARRPRRRNRRRPRRGRCRRGWRRISARICSRGARRAARRWRARRSRRRSGRAGRSGAARPTISAAAWALMSPMRWSATRMLERMIGRISRSSTPRLNSLTGGRRRPSCSTSVA